MLKNVMEHYQDDWRVFILLALRRIEHFEEPDPEILAPKTGMASVTASDEMLIKLSYCFKQHTCEKG